MIAGDRFARHRGDRAARAEDDDAFGAVRSLRVEAFVRLDRLRLRTGAQVVLRSVTKGRRSGQCQWEARFVAAAGDVKDPPAGLRPIGRRFERQCPFDGLHGIFNV